MYLFDIPYHQVFVTAQPVKVKFEFEPPVDAAVGITGYALLTTNKVKSLHSHEHGQFDLLIFCFFFSKKFIFSRCQF